MKQNELAVPFISELQANARLTEVALELPDNLTAQEWENIGRGLGKVGQSTMWWIGDWWAFGKHEYGELKKLVENEDWSGPSYDGCSNAAKVCEAFTIPRRRGNLSFSFHQEVAYLPPDEADALLNECEEDKLTIRQLRDRVRQVKAFLAQGWTKSQLTRKAEVENGHSVLASMRNDKKGVPIDNALIAWAESQDLAVRIDRSSDWGNPYEFGADGTREEVIEWYREYFAHKRSLHKRIKELQSKVLICWCCPDDCHGDVLLEALESL